MEIAFSCGIRREIKSVLLSNISALLHGRVRSFLCHNRSRWLVLYPDSTCLRNVFNYWVSMISLNYEKNYLNCNRFLWWLKISKYRFAKRHWYFWWHYRNVLENIGKNNDDNFDAKPDKIKDNNYSKTLHSLRRHLLVIEYVWRNIVHITISIFINAINFDIFISVIQ